jgi:hypothetical protein
MFFKFLKLIVGSSVYALATGIWVYGPVLPLLLSPALARIENVQTTYVVFAIACSAMAAGLTLFSIFCGARIKTWLEVSAPPPAPATIASIIVTLILGVFTALGRKLISALALQDNLGSQALIVYETIWLFAIAYLAKLFWDAAIDSHRKARARAAAATP